jgi:hypothetical protein
LLANVSIRARVEEILAAGAERAEITVEQVLRELAVLGFSDIGKVVRWRPELVYEELEDADNPDQPVRASEPRPGIDSATLPPEARLAVAIEMNKIGKTLANLLVAAKDHTDALVRANIVSLDELKYVFADRDSRAKAAKHLTDQWEPK